MKKILITESEGDLEKTVLDNVSSYMKKLYTLEQLCQR